MSGFEVVALAEDVPPGTGRAYVRYPPVVWRMPLGLPVVPLVYSENRVCSESCA